MMIVNPYQVTGGYGSAAEIIAQSRRPSQFGQKQTVDSLSFDYWLFREHQT